MPNTTIPAGSVDGKVPVWNRDGLWQVWSVDQIWRGTHGEHKYVPNVGDWVVQPDVGLKPGHYWRVARLDQITLVPELVPFDTGLLPSASLEDVLLYSGPGKHVETYRVYIDQSVRPFTLAVDARFAIHGRDLQRAEIVVGSEREGNLEVISAMYDQSGNYLGTSIPLELAHMRDHSNYATWVIPTCATSRELVNNDIVYVRVYSDTGGFRGEYPMIVENSSFTRLTDYGYRYVTHVSLDTPFLSTSDPHLIEYPLNMPVRGLNLFGIVHYSDGSSVRLPVDGTKFQLFGYENFIATQVGERADLILQYNLSSDEKHYGSTVGTGKYIQAQYRSVTTREDGSYTVKLYGYPVWVSEVVGWRMEYYLYNLDRNTAQRVTSLVSYNANTGGFDPKLYGVKQQLSVSINLQDVNPGYKSWIHAQVLDVTLFRHGTDRSSTQWVVAFERNQSSPYGLDNWCEVTHVNANLRRIDISCKEKTLDAWLERLYYNTKPLFALSRESKAPAPNMFAIVTKAQTYEFPINQWNTQLSLTGLLDQSEAVYVKFFLRTASTDLHLGMAALPVVFKNSP